MRLTSKLQLGNTILKNVLLLWALLSWALLPGQGQYPEIKAIVTDSAAVFTPTETSLLIEKLTAFEKETTNQLVVVTVERLGFETIESYANGLFNQNGLGQEGKDNGLLILFSEQDRKVRIEVGYGLEPYITDAVASRIIRNTMVPRFKKDEYYKGISLATDQLINFLDSPEALEEFKSEIERSETKYKWFGYVMVGLFASIFLGYGGFLSYASYKELLKVVRGMLLGKLGLVPGIFVVLGALLNCSVSLVFMLVPLVVVYQIQWPSISLIDSLLDHKNVAFLFLLVTVAVVAAAIKIRFFDKKKFQFSLWKNDKTYYRKTFSSSGSHSFGSSGSRSGSSSSFSGGGGSSGGGGASGSW
ncbi:TPM domain-containing protein [Maribacter sp. 2307ULW6-5]|uniref:TPM domain-containing protein n=1 Tax=Maribacter sp. 2307ULW6-5 TaxID=3386275 RepID=UPI0039BCB06D